MPEGAETAEAAEVVTTEVEPEGEATTPKGGPSQADIDKLQKALDAERSQRREAEARAKANAEAAQKIQEIEEAGKSETQKLTDRLTRSETRVGELELELAKERVARRHNLTDAQVVRLIGTTEDELEADAQVLLETFQAAPVEVEEEQEPGRQPSATPKPRLKSGVVPSTSLNDDKLLDAIKRKVGVP